MIFVKFMLVWKIGQGPHIRRHSRSWSSINKFPFSLFCQFEVPCFCWRLPLYSCIIFWKFHNIFMGIYRSTTCSLVIQNHKQLFENTSNLKLLNSKAIWKSVEHIHVSLSHVSEVLPTTKISGKSRHKDSKFFKQTEKDKASHSVTCALNKS